MASRLAQDYERAMRRQQLFVVFLWLSVIILSVLVVFPINEVIMAKAGVGSSAEAIERMVNTWIVADRARFALLFVGYVFLLRAFRLPIPSVPR